MYPSTNTPPQICCSFALAVPSPAPALDDDDDDDAAGGGFDCLSTKPPPPPPPDVSSHLLTVKRVGAWRVSGCSSDDDDDDDGEGEGGNAKGGSDTHRRRTGAAATPRELPVTPPEGV